MLIHTFETFYLNYCNPLLRGLIALITRVHVLMFIYLFIFQSNSINTARTKIKGTNK